MLSDFVFWLSGIVHTCIGQTKLNWAMHGPRWPMMAPIAPLETVRPWNHPEAMKSHRRTWLVLYVCINGYKTSYIITKCSKFIFKTFLFWALTNKIIPIKVKNKSNIIVS